MSLPPLTSHAARVPVGGIPATSSLALPTTGWSGGPRCGRGIAGCSRRERRRSQDEFGLSRSVGSRRRCDRIAAGIALLGCHERNDRTPDCGYSRLDADSLSCGHGHQESRDIVIEASRVLDVIADFEAMTEWSPTHPTSKYSRPETRAASKVKMKVKTAGITDEAGGGL